MAGVEALASALVHARTASRPPGTGAGERPSCPPPRTGRERDAGRDSISRSERVRYFDDTGCVSGDRLASALTMRRRELWGSNPRLAERIEMRIKEAQRAHIQAHGTTSDASRCLAEQHPELTTR